MEFVRLDQEFTEVRAKLTAKIRTEISAVEVDRLALMLEHTCSRLMKRSGRTALGGTRCSTSKLPFAHCRTFEPVIPNSGSCGQGAGAGRP